MNRFSFHEDDLFQTGIYNSNRFEELRIQAENFENFSKLGKPDFSKIDYQTEKINSINELKISVETFENLLKSFELNKFSKVYSGYAGKFNKRLKNTVAFGNEENAIIFEFEKGIIKNLWIYNIEYFNKTMLNSLLLEFGQKWNLLLFDSEDFLVELKDSNQIKNYMEKLKN